MNNFILFCRISLVLLIYGCNKLTGHIFKYILQDFNVAGFKYLPGRVCFNKNGKFICILFSSTSMCFKSN